MSRKLKVNIIEATIEGVNKYFCTFISQKYVFKHGLIGSVIIGEVSESELGEIDFKNNFKENPLFKKTIISFIDNEMINDPHLILAAKEQNEGWVYVIDQRTPTPEGEVPPHDIMGLLK